MKIVSILVILAVFYKQSEGISCKTTDDWTGSITLTDKDCTTKCARPKFGGTSYAVAAEGIAWGCGSDCTVAESCVFCETAGCNVELETFECRTDGADNTQKSKCTDIANSDGELVAETECKRTLYDGSNFAAGTWGCGGCADDADNCADCTGTLCNNVAGDDTPTYTCRKYTKSDEVFSEVTEEKDECYENTQGCRMPSPGNTEATWNSCGKDCSSGGLTDTNCQACDAADCNDQATVSYCKTGTHDATKLVSAFCSAEDSKCERPFNTYGTLATQDYACGDCGGGDTATCKVCGPQSDCNTPVDADTHQCFEYAWENNAWVAKAQKQCQAGDAAHKCNMPKKGATDPANDDVSMGGCGPCAGDKDAKCTTTAPGQNVETTHKCYTWTWNDAEDKKKWEYSADAVDCYTLDTETKCSLPKDRSKEEGFVASGVCLKCGTGDTNANCMDSESGKNSGQTVLFSLVALAMPIFYALL